jgi:hypothetical protein
MATSTRATSAAALVGVAAIMMSTPAIAPSATTAAAPRLSAAQVDLAALTDISLSGVYEAWRYSYGSQNPSVCNLGGAPLCRNFGNPVYPTALSGVAYYLVDNLLNTQAKGTLLDAGFQFGPGAPLYVAAYAAGLGPVADAIFFAPDVIKGTIFRLTRGIPVIGPLANIYFYGTWDVFNTEGNLVPVDHGYYGTEALVEFAKDLIRGFTTFGVLLSPASTPARSSAVAGPVARVSNEVRQSRRPSRATATAAPTAVAAPTAASAAAAAPTAAPNAAAAPSPGESDVTGLSIAPADGARSEPSVRSSRGPARAAASQAGARSVPADAADVSVPSDHRAAAAPAASGRRG